jgi:hypothetical protein
MEELDNVGPDVTGQAELAVTPSTVFIKILHIQLG